MAALKACKSKMAACVAAVALVSGVAAGVLHLVMRFDHNSQGEMFDGAGHIDLAYSAFLFFLAFAPVFFLVVIGGSAVLALLWLMRALRFK